MHCFGAGGFFYLAPYCYLYSYANDFLVLLPQFPSVTFKVFWLQKTVQGKCLCPHSASLPTHPHPAQGKPRGPRRASLDPARLEAKKASFASFPRLFSQFVFNKQIDFFCFTIGEPIASLPAP